MSVDGFIAGPRDELGWLTAERPATAPLVVGDWAVTAADGETFADFLSTIGCLVMGRRTYDVVAAFDGPWPYGDTPVLVTTTRPLVTDHATVVPAAGPIETIVASARARAGGRDVYVDGGTTVRSALEAGLIDELVVTLVPTALGAGIALFASIAGPVDFSVAKVAKYGDGLVQITLAPISRR